MSSSIDKVKLRVKSLDESVTKLLESAFNLRESFAKGAQLTIDSAFKLSERAHQTLVGHVREADKELDRLVNEINTFESQTNEQQAEEQQQSLSASKKLKSKVAELNSKLNALNALVCGGTISVNCTENRCGSVGCNRCGLFDETLPVGEQECLNGIESMHMYHSYLVRKFNETYKARENDFKRVLNKLYTSQLHDKKSLNDLADLNGTVTKLIANVNSTTNRMSELIVKSNEMADKYEKSKASVKENLKFVDEARLELDEEDLERNLEKMRVITRNLNATVSKIEHEVEQPLKEAKHLSEQADSHDEMLKKNLESVDLNAYDEKLQNLNEFSQNITQVLQSTEKTNQEIMDLNLQVINFFALFFQMNHLSFICI